MKRPDEWVNRVIPSSEAVPPVEVVFDDVVNNWQALGFGLVTAETISQEDQEYLLDCLTAWGFVTERGAFGGTLRAGTQFVLDLGTTDRGEPAVRWTIDMLRVPSEGLDALLRMLRYLAHGWVVSGTTFVRSPTVCVDQRRKVGVGNGDIKTRLGVPGGWLGLRSLAGRSRGRSQSTLGRKRRDGTRSDVIP